MVIPADLCLLVDVSLVSSAGGTNVHIQVGRVFTQMSRHILASSQVLSMDIPFKSVMVVSSIKVLMPKQSVGIRDSYLSTVKTRRKKKKKKSRKKSKRTSVVLLSTITRLAFARANSVCRGSF